MKITEIRLNHLNSEGNKVIETSKCEGDQNILRPMFEVYKKKMDRSKTDYIYKVENAPANYYSYSLKNSDFESAKKIIPELEKTW